MPSFDPKLEDLVRELNQSARSPAPEHAPDDEPLTAAPGPRLPGPADSGDFAPLDRVLRVAVERGASDLLLIDGGPAVLRLQGRLVRAQGPDLDDEAIRRMLAPLLTAEFRRELERELTVDFSFVREGLGRFRINMHFQRGTLGAAIRSLPARVPTIESLRLPGSLEKLADRKKGLVLVTGSAGSGKSTTLAALIGLINRRHPAHVVTIEDPIEYRHENDRAVIEQIEVGRDAKSFDGALRSILRQSPDVILLGEIRDPETMATAITAAETGHLVFATLHTHDAIRAIGRIVDAFPGDRQNQIRQQLSLGLAAVIAQQLVPGREGAERFPAVEILMGNNAVANLIRRGEDHLLRSQLSLGRHEGMLMMEESLAELVRRRSITQEAAYAHCLREDELRRYLSQ